MKKLVAILLVLLLVGVAAYLLLKPAGDPIVQSFPTSSTDFGTDCGATADSGIWSNRPQAYTDNNPSSDSTSAVASGMIPDNICDDWTGFGFNISADSTILEVLVTFEFRVGSGTAFLNAGLFSGVTRCQQQAYTGNPSVYTTVSFDFTTCKPWTAADLDGSAPGISMAAFPQVNGNKPALVYMDYVKLTVTYTGPPPSSPPPLQGQPGATEVARPASASTIPAFLAPWVLLSVVLLVAGGVMMVSRFWRLLGVILFVVGLIVFAVFVSPYLFTINFAW